MGISAKKLPDPSELVHDHTTDLINKLPLRKKLKVTALLRHNKAKEYEHYQEQVLTTMASAQGEDLKDFLLAEEKRREASYVSLSGEDSLPPLATSDSHLYQEEINAEELPFKLEGCFPQAEEGVWKVNGEPYFSASTSELSDELSNQDASSLVDVYDKEQLDPIHHSSFEKYFLTKAAEEYKKAKVNSNEEYPKVEEIIDVDKIHQQCLKHFSITINGYDLSSKVEEHPLHQTNRSKIDFLDLYQLKKEETPFDISSPIFPTSVPSYAYLSPLEFYAYQVLRRKKLNDKGYVNEDFCKEEILESQPFWGLVGAFPRLHPLLYKLINGEVSDAKLEAQLKAEKESVKEAKKETDSKASKDDKASDKTANSKERKLVPLYSDEEDIESLADFEHYDYDLLHQERDFYPLAEEILSVHPKLKDADYEPAINKVYAKDKEGAGIYLDGDELTNEEVISNYAHASTEYLTFSMEYEREKIMEIYDGLASQLFFPFYKCFDYKSLYISALDLKHCFKKLSQSEQELEALLRSEEFLGLPDDELFSFMDRDEYLDLVSGYEDDEENYLPF